MKAHQLVLISFSLFIAACQTTPINTATGVDLPVQFDNVAELPAHNVDLSQWWNEWHDPELTALINEGLENSNSIKKAKQNIEIAKSYQSIVQADLWPMIGILGKTSQLNSDIENSVLKEIGMDKVDSKLKLEQVGVFARWDLDIFGQKQNQAKAAYYNLLTTQEMFHASQMALSSRIAESYFNAIATQYQIQITDQALSRLNDLLNYSRGRFEAGQATPNDIDRIKANITQLNSQRELLFAQFEDIQKNIAVLVGKSPQGYRLKYNLQSLDYLPPAPTGIQPSEIVYRRPDLLAKQKQIVSLVAKTDAARADLFPKFYVNFGAMDGKIKVKPFSRGGISGPFFDVGVHLPIFTAGKIRANIKLNEALLQKALYDYDDSLLNALKEVDSAYRWRTAYDKSVVQSSGTENILQKRSRDSEKLFKYGEITYEKVPLNYMEYFRAREENIRHKLNSVRSTIFLYQTLGGGWQYQQLEPQPAIQYKRNN